MRVRAKTILCYHCDGACNPCDDADVCESPTKEPDAKIPTKKVKEIEEEEEETP